MIVIFFIFVVSRIRSLDAVIDFTGSVFFSILSFIAPVIIYEKTCKNKGNPIWSFINYAVLILGSLVGFIGAYRSAGRIFK